MPPNGAGEAGLLALRRHKEGHTGPVVDEDLVKELVRDFQRALLQADVNVQLDMELSKSIEKRVLEEELPPGISRREHVVKVVYDELPRARVLK